MATTKCCSGGTCDSIVTIGYMREMAKKRLGHGSSTPCVSVSSATPFSSCCTADESAYTPTYREITGGTYASVRALDNSNPVNDVNGFSSYTQTIDTNCCSISVNEKVLPHSALTFGYTEIYGVSLNATKIPSVCDPSYEIKQIDTFRRHTFGCSNDSIVEISSSPTEVTFSGETISDRLTKTYGDISISGELTAIVTGKSTIIVNGNTLTRTTTDSCGYSKSGSISFASSSYTASVTLDCSKKIECDGGDVEATISSGSCGNEVSILSVRLNTEEQVVSSITGNKLTVHIPRNNDSNTYTVLYVGIQIGDKTAELSGLLDREICRFSPKPITDIDCGVFPGEDDWSEWVGRGLMKINDCQ